MIRGKRQKWSESKSWFRSWTGHYSHSYSRSGSWAWSLSGAGAGYGYKSYSYSKSRACANSKLGERNGY